MAEDEQNGLDPDDELVMPEEDELERKRRESQKAELPERSATRSSPLVRRVIGGEVKGKRGEHQERPATEPGGRGAVVRREVGPGTAAEPRRSTPGDSAGPRPGREGAARKDQSAPPNSSPGFVAREQPSLPGRPGGEAGPPGREAAGGAEPTAAPGPARRRRRRGFDQEAEWQDGGRAPVWWLGAGILCVLMIGVAVFVMVRRGGVGEPVTLAPRPPEVFVPQTSYESLPIAEFVAKSAELLPVVKKTLTMVESGEGGAEWLRGGEASMKRRQEWRKRYPAPPPFREEGLHEIHASGNDSFAYILLTGEREGFVPFMAYFVKSGDRMLLDWEATEGYGEVLVHEADILQDGKPRMMRAVIDRSSFYTDVFPEESYRCYTLHHDDPGEWLWAYADRNSEVDHRILSHMMQRDGLGRHQQVTVKIARGPDGSRSNQVRIVAFEFGGWIEPAGPAQP